jgi:hypothetical protein
MPAMFCFARDHRAKRLAKNMTEQHGDFLSNFGEKSQYCACPFQQLEKIRRNHAGKA